MCIFYTLNGLPLLTIGIKCMKAIIYNRFMVQLRNSILDNIGAVIPVKLWNRGPF
jgi:hypothetical protein